MSITAVKKTCDNCGGSLEFSSWHYADVSLCGECNGKRIAQPRFDWEFEEQRTNDLEDLVLQLVERIEKLELCVRYPLQEVTTTCSEPQSDVNHKPGQQIAKAIKAME